MGSDHFDHSSTIGLRENYETNIKNTQVAEEEEVEEEAEAEEEESKPAKGKSKAQKPRGRPRKAKEEDGKEDQVQLFITI